MVEQQYAARSDRGASTSTHSTADAIAHAMPSAHALAGSAAYATEPGPTIRPMPRPLLCPSHSPIASSSVVRPAIWRQSTIIATFERPPSRLSASGSARSERMGPVINDSTR